MRASPRRPRLQTVTLRWAALALVLGALMAAQTPSMSASSGTVVGATVPSATTLLPGTCTTGQANITQLGNILPGATAVSANDCTITFGSSNDTSMLRVFQSDGALSAMGRDQFGFQTSPAVGNVNSVSVVDATTAFAIDNSGNVLRTTDGGATWSIRSTIAYKSGIHAVDANTLWVVGSTAGVGKIGRSTDGGTTFVDQSPGGAPPLRSVSMVSASLGWSVGFGGAVYQWNGATWTLQPVGGITDDLYKVRAANASTVFAVGMNGRILNTVDGGATWVSQNNTPGLWIDGLAVADASRAWAFGDVGTILATTNGGATWTPQTSNTTQRLFGGVAADANTVWAAGDNAALLKTTDGGTTWVAEPAPFTTGRYLEIDASDATTAWLVGQFSGIHGLPSTRVTDYAAGSDFATAGAGFFAICLKGVATATATWPTTGACPASDGTNWRAVPQTSGLATAKAATAVSGTTSATASFRFAFRTLASQPPGVYKAPLTFEVLAPAA